LVATGYTRVVIGGRGPYIEFEDKHIVKDHFHIPKHAAYKLSQTMPYYHEYRSNDKCFVKAYCQQMQVSYADYRVGKWYIDPEKVKTDEFENLLLPPYPGPYNVAKSVEITHLYVEEKAKPSLFDL
jgi:hypothetical protein